MTAIIDGNYRYVLKRSTGEGRGVCVWVMLNPSTADATTDDPTIRKVVKFTRAWGFLDVVVVNLFAWRATDPKQLKLAWSRGNDVVGGDNNMHIQNEAARADRLMFAWGANAFSRGRDVTVIRMLSIRNAVAMNLGLNKDGSPKHPLYIRDDQQPAFHVNVGIAA